MASRHVALTWQHDLVFRGEGSGTAPVTIDGDNAAGPGPMENLLLSLAACTGSDVVVVLKKKRLAIDTLRVDVEGDRRDEHPQRYVAIRLIYRIRALGLTEQQARHAIDLSLQKYCSVTHSLNPDIALTYALDLQA